MPQDRATFAGNVMDVGAPPAVAQARSAVEAAGTLQEMPPVPLAELKKK